jgi:hypothetical protein
MSRRTWYAHGMGTTNVTGRNYGTHCQGDNGRTLCKGYAIADVNCQTRDPDQERQASCKKCQAAMARRTQQAEE